MAKEMLKIKRGDVVFPPLVEVAVSKRSKENAGAVYPAPAGWTLDDFEAFWGKERVAKVFFGKVKTLCQNWYKDAFVKGEDGKPTGEVDWDDFLTMFTSFSARGESVASIKEALLDCASRLGEIEFDITNPEKLKAAAELANSIKSEMKALYKDLQEKKNKTPEDVAEEAAGGVPLPA